MKTMIKEIEQKEKIENFRVEFKNSKKLKSFLQSAMNTATSLTSYIPKITDELVIVVNQYQKSIKDKINLKDKKKLVVKWLKKESEIFLKQRIKL